MTISNAEIEYASYPLANIGVSGRLHDVWRRLSSCGLGVVCLMYAPGIRFREFDSAIRSCEWVECVACGDIKTFEVL